MKKEPLAMKNPTEDATSETTDTCGDARIVVTFDGVSKRFGAHEVLHDVSCKLPGGQIIAVTGANGSGKSTFLRLAGHLLRPSGGRVTVTEATSLGGNVLTREALRRELGLLSPEIALSPELTGNETLDFLLGLRGITFGDKERKALLQRVGLAAEDASKRTKACSTGQRQRLALAVLIASNARLWLLDEPGANLDAAGRDIIRREARNAAKRGALVLVATNDENEAAWADEVITLGERALQTKASPFGRGAERMRGGAGTSEARSEASPRYPTQSQLQRTRSVALRAPALPEGEPCTGATIHENRNNRAKHQHGIQTPVLSLLRRDFTSSLRSRSSLAVMALFAVTALFALSFSLGGAVLEPPLLAALLWTLLFFAASMGLGAAFGGEEAAGTLLALRVYGAGQAVLAGKTAFAFSTLLLLSVVLVPLFFLLLDAACAAPLLFLATLVLGLGGFAAAGTLLSALTASAAGRQASAGGLLPVLLLPVLLPVFLPAVALTSAAFGGREAGLSMLVGMGLYDALLAVGASLLFDALWYED